MGGYVTLCSRMLGVPVLSLDVVDDGGVFPGQQGRNHQTDALTRTGWCKRHDMLWPIVAKVVVFGSTDEDALATEQTGAQEKARSNVTP